VTSWGNLRVRFTSCATPPTVPAPSIAIRCVPATATATAPCNPSPPPSISVSPTSVTQPNTPYTVSWQASASSCVTSYQLEELFNQTQWQPVPLSQAQNQQRQWSPDPPKSVSGTYAYRVSACGGGTCSTHTVGAVVTVSIPVDLGVPTGLQACTKPPGRQCVAAGSPEPLIVKKGKRYEVSWEAVANATSYQVREVRSTNQSCGALQTDYPTNGSPMEFLATTIACNGAERETNYAYAIRACAGANCGGWTDSQVVVRAVATLSRAANATTYYHTDALGSPVAETDAAGAVVKRRAYRPWGAPVTGSYEQGPGYTGHVTDALTGLSYMQQPYYDPLAGRFLSVDPIPASPASFNRYAYVLNNPYKYIDLDGRFESSPWLLATVPGQGSFDNAMTSMENGNYGQAAIYGATMLGEQILSVATLGQGRTAGALSNSLIAARI